MEYWSITTLSENCGVKVMKASRPYGVRYNALTKYICCSVISSPLYLAACNLHVVTYSLPIRLYIKVMLEY